MTAGMHVGGLLGAGICEIRIFSTRRDRPVRSVGSACCDRVRLVDVRYGLYVSIEPGITEAGNCGDYGFPGGECQAHVARSCQR